MAKIKALKNILLFVLKLQTLLITVFLCLVFSQYVEYQKFETISLHMSQSLVQLDVINLLTKSQTYITFNQKYL